MSKITVVAKLVAKKESEERVKSELLKLIAPTRNEEGCIEYNLLQDNEDPAVFVFYETWKDLPSIGKHVKTDHYQSYVSAVADLLQEKTVHKMTRID